METGHPDLVDLEGWKIEGFEYRADHYGVRYLALVLSRDGEGKAVFIEPCGDQYGGPASLTVAHHPRGPALWAAEAGLEPLP